MEDYRPKPEILLKQIQQEEKNKQTHTGRLKIFFGYAAGVGKTYAMLKAAHAAKRRGIDIVIGYIEPHQRPETSVLVKGLEQLPVLCADYKGITLNEFDLDEALKRKPQIILVDELAHSNAEICRHSKRYQDIQELLRNGIDVYTTVNVQHIESINDIVESITGIAVRERIPDFIFDDSSQVELIDIEPQELLERLKAGKIYQKEQAIKAVNNFFDIKNLTALREIALRRCADRVNKMSDEVRASMHSADYYTDEHILVCLSSSPTNAKNIRTAARIAQAFRGTFTALFVEKSDYSEMSEENKKRLRNNMRLAQELGAGIETVQGDDISFQIAEFARLNGVSKIVLGKSNVSKKFFWNKPSLTDQLTAQAPFLDIYIIPEAHTTIKQKTKIKLKKTSFSMADFIKSCIILMTATGIGYSFYCLGFSNSNIIIVYLLSVLAIAMLTSHKLYCLLFSMLSVLMFNFFFTEPRFSFNSYDTGNFITFVIMFIIAFIISSVVAKLKSNEAASASTVFRTNALLDTTQHLQKIKSENDIIKVLAEQLMKLLDKDIIFYPIKDNQLDKGQIFWAHDDKGEKTYLTENEKAVALWVYKNNKHAGASTNTLNKAKSLYLAVRIKENIYGVVGIVLENASIPAFENGILLSILGECALAFENLKISKDNEEASLLAQKEQLRANLLRTISHDLRTPLTSISGNADILLNNNDKLTPEMRKNLYTDIYDDSLWLINLVENILSVTKIEDGKMRLNFTPELIEDIVDESLKHINKRKKLYHISVQYEEDFLMANIDAHLIVQVFINLLDNALKYTPEGSHIEIIAKKQYPFINVQICDDGRGISNADKEKIFDMFYTANMPIADSKRSTGLGLALCKSIILAHGGTITVKDNIPHGTVFEFTLPMKGIEYNE